MAETAIQFTNVRKNYGKVQAHQGLNLDDRTGEVFGFLEPNGTGKTMTIRCMPDLIRSARGSIRVFGLDQQHDSRGVRTYISG